MQRLFGFGGGAATGNGYYPNNGGYGGKKIIPTLGVSFGLPYPTYGYPLSPHGHHGINPHFGAISPNGLNLGLLNVNPLFSLEVTKSEQGTKLVKPYVNLHVTPSENIIGQIGSLFAAKKGALHKHKHYHLHRYPPPPFGVPPFDPHHHPFEGPHLPPHHFEGPPPHHFDGPPHHFDGPPPHHFNGPPHHFDGPPHPFEGPPIHFGPHPPIFEGHPPPHLEGPPFLSHPPPQFDRPHFSKHSHLKGLKDLALHKGAGYDGDFANTPGFRQNNISLNHFPPFPPNQNFDGSPNSYPYPPNNNQNYDGGLNHFPPNNIPNFDGGLNSDQQGYNFDPQNLQNLDNYPQNVQQIYENPNSIKGDYRYARQFNYNSKSSNHKLLQSIPAQAPGSAEGSDMVSFPTSRRRRDTDQVVPASIEKKENLESIDAESSDETNEGRALSAEKVNEPKAF